MHTSGASRRGVASACLMSTRAPHSQPSSPANGAAEWPPDDRLQRTIQYSEVPVMESKSCGDRDRGEPRGSAPPTPPYVRVRIRRFDRLSMLGCLNGCEAERFEY